MTDQTYTADEGIGAGSSDGGAPDELEALVETVVGLWGDIVATVKKIFEGNLEDTPFAERPEVLVGVAFGAGLLTALVLKRLGRR